MNIKNTYFHIRVKFDIAEFCKLDRSTNEYRSTKLTIVLG